MMTMIPLTTTRRTTASSQLALLLVLLFFQASSYNTCDAFSLGGGRVLFSQRHQSTSALSPGGETKWVHASQPQPQQQQQEHTGTTTRALAQPDTETDAETEAPPPTLGELPLTEAEQVGFSAVKNIIAVSSCKGGVGKSTTSVNLAYSLQKLGYQVGILDADVYGPSLPTMITPLDEHDVVKFVGRQIQPLVGPNGVKLMSFGYINDGAAVMRGPMVDQLLQQFLTVIHWGTLDYLILDLPPGTGDIQLTLSQKLNITAAVIITTPQELSFVDVARGIDMFGSVNIPCIAVVENMAYYEPEIPTAIAAPNQSTMNDAALKAAFTKKLAEYTKIDETTNSNKNDAEQLATELLELLTAHQCDIQAQQSEEDNDDSNKIWLFGKGHLSRLSQQYGIPMEQTFRMPLLPSIATSGDTGVPFILDYPDSKQAKVYTQLAHSVVTEVQKLAEQGSQRLQVTFDFDDSRMLQVVDPSLQQTKDDTKLFTTLSPVLLRRECKCAACVEEMTGRQLLDKSTVSPNVQPRRGDDNMEPYGNYALSINWSDGHKSLYPYKQIQALIAEQEEEEQK
jgi:Mrp family chromosome partitioning ATPase/DUF971 family protein